MRRSFRLLLALTYAACSAAEQRQAADAAVNPIRKVVTLLQAMQKKVAAEGAREAELFKKYMCYCKSSGATLKEEISSGEAKISELGTSLEEARAAKEQLQAGLKQDQADRAAAKKSMADATALRNKEAAAFADLKAESDENVDAIFAAIKALEKGMGVKDSRLAYSAGYRSTAEGEGVAPAFLQSDKAQVLRKLLAGKMGRDMAEDDRQKVLSFLSGPPGFYVASSDQIVGILKQMADEMAKGLVEATAAEEAAIKEFKALMSAKMKEVAALTAAIENKLQKIGETSVAIAKMENELGDTEEALADDKKFLADLKKGCSTIEKQTEENMKLRTQELAALAETIKVLNDDDALELFKKTLPSAGASLLQMSRTAETVRARALAAVRAVYGQSVLPHRVNLDFISLALHGDKLGFDKVIKMIDDLVAILKKEQIDDNDKKEYCASQLDLTDDKKKSLERSISDEEDAIAATQDAIATTTQEIEALKAAIKALDKSVAEATAQRKAEHEAFTDLIASDSAAKELLNYAKNRLNKFYNPKLYKAAPEAALSAEDRVFVAEGGSIPTEAPGGIAGTGISAMVQQHEEAAPPPPPETYGKFKAKASGGVIDMLNMLINDLDKDMTEAETTEKDAQADYEQLMRDSAEKRTADSQTLIDKEDAKASLEGELQAHQEEKRSLGNELGATLKYLAATHADCDWLLKFFDVRQEARTSEIDALNNAKAVLSGADYSLIQGSSFLARVHRQ